jgi:hypothetical protein
LIIGQFDQNINNFSPKNLRNLFFKEETSMRAKLHKLLTQMKARPERKIDYTMIELDLKKKHQKETNPYDEIST